MWKALVVVGLEVDFRLWVWWVWLLVAKTREISSHLYAVQIAMQTNHRVTLRDSTDTQIVGAAPRC